MCCTRRVTTPAAVVVGFVVHGHARTLIADDPIVHGWRERVRRFLLFSAYEHATQPQNHASWVRHCAQSTRVTMLLLVPLRSSLQYSPVVSFLFFFFYNDKRVFAYTTLEFDFVRETTSKFFFACEGPFSSNEYERLKFVAIFFFYPFFEYDSEGFLKNSGEKKNCFDRSNSEH